MCHKFLHWQVEWLVFWYSFDRSEWLWKPEVNAVLRHVTLFLHTFTSSLLPPLHYLSFPLFIAVFCHQKPDTKMSSHFTHEDKWQANQTICLMMHVSVVGNSLGSFAFLARLIWEDLQLPTFKRSDEVLSAGTTSQQTTPSLSDCLQLPKGWQFWYHLACTGTKTKSCHHSQGCCTSPGMDC